MINQLTAPNTLKEVRKRPGCNCHLHLKTQTAFNHQVYKYVCSTLMFQATLMLKFMTVQVHSMCYLYYLLVLYIVNYNFVYYNGN